MLRRAVLTVRPSARILRASTQPAQIRHASASLTGAPRVTLSPPQETTAASSEDTDPNMNGRYPDVPRVKRSLRDPYDNWWDKQERRNYNEPLHEDNDILGVFSTEKYTFFTMPKAWFLMGSFVATVFALCQVVSYTYPDTPAVPKRYVDGLEKELGGPSALPALKQGDE